MMLDWFIFNGWTVAIVAVLLILLVSRSKQWPVNLPPGPTGYPFIGSMLLLRGKKPKDTFRRLRAEFGDVFSVTVWRNVMVVINGTDALKEAFIKRAKDFSDRPDTYRSVHLMKRKGIAMSSGQHWKHTRTFALTTLREFGFGKKSLEARVMEEVRAFLEVMENSIGKVYDPKRLIQVSISNIICSIVFGKRFEHGDAIFDRLVGLLEEAFRLNNVSRAGQNMSWLRFLPGDYFKIKRNRDNFYELSNYMQQQITEHRKTFDPNNVRDFIDAFLKEQEKQDPGSAVFEDFNLEVTIDNLFLAGTETTATTISWTILQLVYHTDIQDRLRREINNVVGPSRFPTLSDKPNMPFYEAVITESLRFGNIAPLSVPHGTSKDIEFRGMTIPKGSVIIPNLDSVHFDPNVFEEPRKFNPDRFIGEDGKLNGKEKNLLAFSLGRRICMGESLARLELFLFVTSLIQRFELLPENPNKMPTGPPSHGILSGPPDYKIKALKIS